MHRSRLFAQHLPFFGWEPVILTVHEKFYEEKLDYNLEKLLPGNLRVEKVDAFGITKPRIIGDIGLRGFFQLYRKAKQLIKREQFDFLYIPIPSFYIALLGRWLHKTTGIPYGIDYIDPWVHYFPGSNKIFSRHWLSTQIAKWLEPIAVKHVSLITGVAEGYYKGVLERNPHLLKSCLTGAMPYGGELRDHQKLAYLQLGPYLFKKNINKVQLVYAGAMLPKAYAPLEAVLRSIKQDTENFAALEIHFIGTGKTPDDPDGFNIRPLAEKYGLWQNIVFEYPRRIPYLDVLVHLEAASGVFILGSTEPHYTPSKVYQAVLAGKPILALLHEESSAVAVLKEAAAGRVFTFNAAGVTNLIESGFASFYKEYVTWAKVFKPEQVNASTFESYSAKQVTAGLASLLDAV